MINGQLSNSSTCSVSEHAPSIKCLIPVSVMRSQLERALHVGCEVNVVWGVCVVCVYSCET